MTVVLAVFSVPFWTNNLVNWDLVGHWASTVFQSEQVFPAVTGWNPSFYLGAPHNQLYPPLLTLLGGAAGQLVPTIVALKWIVVLSFLATPLAGYWMARQYRLRQHEALLATFFLVCALLLVQPNGGDAYSTFVIGNISEALGIPLLLLYAGFLRRSATSRRYRASGVLLALCVLANYFVATAALIIGLGEAIIAVFERRLRPLLAHWILAFLLTSFFVLPWFGALPYLSSIRFIDQEPFRYVELFLLFAVTASLGWLVRQRRELRALILSFAVLVVVRFLLPDVVHTPVQIFRLNFFFFLFGAVLFGTLILELARAWSTSSRWVTPVNIRLLVIAAPVLLFGSLLVSRLLTVDLRGVRPSPPVPSLPESSGRIFVIQSPNERYSQHGLQHLVAVQQRRMVNKGLFIESAINARYLLDLEQALVGTESPAHVRTWGIHWDYNAVKDGALAASRLKLLQLFGFDAIVTGDQLDPAIIDAAKEKKQLMGSLWWYRYDNTPLVEPITVPLIPVVRHWQREALSWFLQTDLTSMLVDSIDTIASASTDVSVTEMNISEIQNDLRFRINGEHPAPVLIKISYFPNWRATIDGKPVPVYRVSPNLMMVYGKGDVHLWYGRTRLDAIGLAGTLFGLAFLIFSLFRRKHHLTGNVRKNPG